jgi:hypothetical protein
MKDQFYQDFDLILLPSSKVKLAGIAKAIGKYL